MLEMVPLKKVKDNPWRDRVRNPIDPERVEAIATSIEKTKKYWTGTYGRKVAGGFVELAFGHHRYEAAKIQGLKEIPITIEDFTDGEMLVWMAQENVRGEMPVVLEAVNAVVRALGEGKIEIEAPSKDTPVRHLRYAPSFVPGKVPSTTAVERPYTVASIARYLGYAKKTSNEPKNSVVAAVGILERAEVAKGEGGEKKAAAVERSFSLMKVNDAVKAVSELRQRESKVAARTEALKKEAAEIDAKQRQLQADIREREAKEEAKRKELVAKMAEAKREEDEKKAREIKERLEFAAKGAADKAVLDGIRMAALEAKVEETKKREMEAKKEDAYLPIKREVERILHKLEGSTATSKDALAEEIKSLARQALNNTDRERLRQAALNFGTWYCEWVSVQFLPPFGAKRSLTEYRSREEAKRRAQETKDAKAAAKKEKSK